MCTALILTTLNYVITSADMPIKLHFKKHNLVVYLGFKSNLTMLLTCKNNQQTILYFLSLDSFRNIVDESGDLDPTPFRRTSCISLQSSVSQLLHTVRSITTLLYIPASRPLMSRTQLKPRHNQTE